jgi:hypothetical protein
MGANIPFEQAKVCLEVAIFFPHWPLRINLKIWQSLFTQDIFALKFFVVNNMLVPI